MKVSARLGIVFTLVVIQGVSSPPVAAEPSAVDVSERGRAPRISGLDAYLQAGEPPSDADLATRIDRAAAERAAIARNPALRAADHRVRSLLEASRSEGALPEPELMAWLWQVPLARPLAVGDAGMLMVGLQQRFPAFGSLGAESEARAHEARAETAATLTEARDLVQSVDQSFVDYVEATSRHRVHLEHQRVLQRVADLARARYVAAGSLADVAQAETELARVEADLATDGGAIDAARARLNALLSRAPDAPLGEPVQEEPRVAGVPQEQLVARALGSRPEVRVAEERREAAAAHARASDLEATIPSFSIAALYFAPVGPMPTNGYGVNFSMTLPWLWGARSRRAKADEEMAAAEESEAQEVRVRAAGDVGGMAAVAKGTSARYSALLERALPRSERAREAAEAGYASNRGDILSVLAAERAVVDIRMDLVTARAALDHALVGLDRAAGARLPREPLPHSEGADHGR